MPISSQLGVNACGLEHTIHILARFVVVDVDRAHNLVHPCTGDNVCVAVALMVQSFPVVAFSSTSTNSGP